MTLLCNLFTALAAILSFLKSSLYLQASSEPIRLNHWLRPDAAPLRARVRDEVPRPLCVLTEQVAEQRIGGMLGPLPSHGMGTAASNVSQTIPQNASHHLAVVSVGANMVIL